MVEEKVLKKAEKLESRAEGWLLKIFDTLKKLKIAEEKHEKKRLERLQRWEGMFERREWRSFKRLVSRLDELKKDLPEYEQERLGKIEDQLKMNEKNLADQLSKRTGKLHEHIKAEDWDTLDEEIGEIEELVQSTETIFKNELEPELHRLEKAGKRILLVEDKPEAKAGAELYFKTRRDIQVIYAKDYEEAMKLLETKPDGLITDCFFPRITGSKDTTLGMEVIEKIAPLDPKTQEIMSEFSKYVNLDEELRDLVYKFAQSSKEGRIDVAKIPAIRAIARVSESIGKAQATQIAKNSLGVYKQEKISREFNTSMKLYLEKSPSNQPLGILVAEKAKGLGIPIVLATDTHHHGEATQPITNYAGKEGWPLIDTGYGNKSSPEFWGRACEVLEKLM